MAAPAWLQPQKVCLPLNFIQALQTVHLTTDDLLQVAELLRNGSQRRGPLLLGNSGHHPPAREGCADLQRSRATEWVLAELFLSGLLHDGAASCQGLPSSRGPSTHTDQKQCARDPLLGKLRPGACSVIANQYQPHHRHRLLLAPARCATCGRFLRPSPAACSRRCADMPTEPSLPCRPV